MNGEKNIEALKHADHTENKSFYDDYALLHDVLRNKDKIKQTNLLYENTKIKSKAEF